MYKSLKIYSLYKYIEVYAQINLLIIFSYIILHQYLFINLCQMLFVMRPLKIMIILYINVYLSLILVNKKKKISRYLVLDVFKCK